MARKTKAPASVEAPEKGGLEKKFAVDKLRENCRRLFGVSTSTFDGATYGMTGKYTVEELKAHIEAWKKRGVE